MSDLVDEVGLGNEEAGQLAGGMSRDYDLELEAGQLVRLEVEQRGVDVAVELRDPEDKLLIRVDSPTGRRDAEKLLAVAESTGTHRLVVEGAEKGAPEGQYLYRLLEKRPARQEDRDRAAAERVFSQAEELRRQSESQSAIERYQEALDAWRSLGDPGREADTLLGLGRVHEALSDLETARQLMEQAAERFVQAGRPRGQGTALNFLGYLLWGLGETDEALRRSQEALEVFRAAGLRDGVAGALHNFGLYYRQLGETEKALEAYRQALEIYEEFGEVDRIARTRGSLAALYLQQGEVATVEDHLEAALSVWTTLEDQRHQALVLYRLGEVRKRQERLDEAVDYLERALELHRSLKDRRREAATLNALGTVHLLGGAYESARAAYEEALALYRELGNARGEAFAIHNLGRLHLPAQGWAGDPQKAFDYFERAAPFFEKLGDRQVEASNTYGSARALAELGRLDAARERLAASFGLVEELRTETHSEELRIAFFATKQHYYDLYVDVLMRLDEKEPGKGWAEQAFEISEHRRARALLDTLGESASEIRRGADPALVDEEAAVQKELNVLERRRRALAAISPADQVVAIEKSLRKNREKLAEVRRRLRNAAYDSLAGAKPLTVSEIRGRLLNSRTLLLVYSLGEERSFLWAVSRDAVRSHVLEQGRAEIESTVNEARKLLIARRQDSRNPRQRLLARLGDLLLGPVADELTYKRLVIVADGALLYLPFAALPKPGADPRPDGEISYLVEHHEIVNLPSASLLEGLRREFAGRYPAPNQIAVFANPKLVPGQESSEQHPNRSDLDRSTQVLGIERFEPLPGTLEEAKAILDLAQGVKLEALGVGATKAKVVGGDVRDYQILHFATHGIVNREAPELSGLVLSLYNESDLPVDGFLHLHEIYNLDLAAELVVLSACETGLGPMVRGEGLIGLTRGFMYAGVPRVLVSLWKVSDQGTAELMRRFYWSLFEVGASPAEALRAAQISLLEDEKWNQPNYWASFVLQGDWRLPGGADEDSDIEGAFLGEGDDDAEDMDLPIPDDVCADPAEPWMKDVCEILKRLRRTGDEP